MSIAGQIRHRSEVPRPTAYAVFDCETTGTEVGSDEIISFAVIRLDGEGNETARFARLVQPSRPIPADATAVHGITDEDVSTASRFAEITEELLDALEGAVFVAHNSPFDLAMLRDAFRRVGIEYRPPQVACTLDAYRLLEPTAADHRLESLCARHQVVLEDAHDALSDVLATVGLLRLLLDRDLAPETARLDLHAYLRLRARGDRRPASAGQIRRVFALARAAGVDRFELRQLIARATDRDDVDALTREQVQDVFDVLELLVERAPRAA
jgi:DNA polymerase III epsilon subunit family exonuclease